MGYEGPQELPVPETYSAGHWSPGANVGAAASGKVPRVPADEKGMASYRASDLSPSSHLLSAVLVIAGSSAVVVPCSGQQGLMMDGKTEFLLGNINPSDSGK